MRVYTPAFSVKLCLLLWVNFTTVFSQWSQPLFRESLNPHPNVTWIESQVNNVGQCNILEGTPGKAELLRLSYTDESDSPTLVYVDKKGLNLEIVKDDNPDFPYFLQASEQGDYESEKTVQVVVSAKGTSGNVFVHVGNVNDNPPTIVSPEQCEVEELFTGVTNCEFQVTDEDGGACYAEMSTDDDHFKLRLMSDQTKNCKSATFALEVTTELDYEKFRLHSLMITAADDGRIGPDEKDVLLGEQTRTVSFVVNVLDMPDEAPIWRTLVPSISVNEKTDWDEQFVAVDGDYGLNWTIEYHLEFDESYDQYKDYFAVDETGLLTGKSMDRDSLKVQIFKLYIVATEVPDYERFPNVTAMNETSSIVIILNDINDNSPTFEPKMFSFKTEEEQYFSIKQFRVTDLDLGDAGTFDLTLENNTFASNFSLIPGSGYQNVMVSIAPLDPSVLDYEDKDWRVITLKLVATEVEENSHFDIATLIIELEDVIDEPPEFTQKTYNVKFTENQPEGFLVEQTVAIDPDENDVVTYSLQNAYMKIDSENGNITTISSNAFDYERESEIIIQVIAVDLGNFRDFCTVQIELIDLNDEPPTLTVPDSQYEVDEHSDVGTVVSDIITATDPDTTADLQFEIDWDLSVAYKQGIKVTKESYRSSVKLEVMDGVWKAQLVIANNDTFDWELFDTLKLQINVTDINTDEGYEKNKKRSAFVTVAVGDINDCFPIFTEESRAVNFTVTENTVADRFLGALVATDDDSEINSNITYSIEPLLPLSLVEDISRPRVKINMGTGQIYTTNIAIDCDEWQQTEFVYKVTASDGLNENSANISLFIEDLNDEIPSLVEPQKGYVDSEFEEHKPGRFQVTCIISDDKDVTDDYHTISYSVEGSAILYFEMDKDCNREEECCLWVIEGKELDRENDPYHLVQVYSRDNFKDGIKVNSNEGPTTVVNITLIDINDNPPVFEIRDKPTEFYETKLTENYLVFSVEVTDLDIGLNGEIQCNNTPEVTLDYPVRLDTDTEGLFRVETGSNVCNVYTEKDMTYRWGNYSLKLWAHDLGDDDQQFGRQTGFGIYKLNVINENLHSPVITYPTLGGIIRISRDQTLNDMNALIDMDGEPVKDITADDEDDPSTPNGQISFTLTGGRDVFKLYIIDSKSARLVMMMFPDAEDRIFDMKLRAQDRALIGNKSTEVDFSVYVLNRDSSPEFTQEEVAITFTENTKGLEENFTLPAAINQDEALMQEDQRRAIYYYIIEGDEDLFALDKSSGVITLRQKLDYEIAPEYSVRVFATHTNTKPEQETYWIKAILNVTIKVKDINDKPPQFSQDLFLGTFSADQETGKEVIKLEAHDPDSEDEMKFEMKSGTMTAKDTSLEQFVTDTTFLVNLETGIITLNFDPGKRALSGYFEFDVVVYDSAGNTEGHRDEATVNIYVVSQAHQVQFHFYNPVDLVLAKENEMAAAFSEVLQYSCTVDKIQRSEEESGLETTDVVTHFVDNDKKIPILRSVIENKFLEPDTYSTLYMAMSEMSLSFRGFLSQEEPEEERNYLTIVMAAVCAVLAVLVVVFSLAFVVRTRTLNKRISKLTETANKGILQDTGLRQDSMVVPGTNQHTDKGSNPVYQLELDNDFDNESQSSGDSDLIGIEDSPEFGGAGKAADGVDNRAFDLHRDKKPYSAPSFSASLDGQRRTSINPLAAAAFADGEVGSFADVGMPRRISLNPLAMGANDWIDEEVVDESGNTVPGEANFSFQQTNAKASEL